MKKHQVAVAAVAIVILGNTSSPYARAQNTYPSVEGIQPFTQAANYMSLAGYLRYRYYLESGRWISRAEAENAAGEPRTVAAPGTTTTGTTTDSNSTQPMETNSNTEQVITTPSGLKIQDLQVGTGDVAAAGKNVTVHYRGTLTNGNVFDESYRRGEPFSFGLGAGQVIRGWDEGVAGMRIGGKRRLTIPPELGYGARGAGNVIPPNATLIFDVELLEVQ